ncbi:MAG: hypothetical protein V4550_15605 [Gemmatimonadota bacterium]
MASSLELNLVRHVRIVAYLILGAAFFMPIADFFFSVWPVQRELAYRYGAVTLMASTVSQLVLTLLFIYALALLAEDRKIIAACGIAGVLIAAILVVSFGAFAMDAWELRRRLEGAPLLRMETATLQAALKIVSYAAVCVVFTISARRALTTPKDNRERGANSGSRATNTAE